MAEDDYVDGGGLSPYSDPFSDTAVASQTQGVEHVWFSQAAIDVLAERRRQVEAEGWTPEHDDGHEDGSLAMAATCYAQPDPVMEKFPSGEQSPEGWPWAAIWWKPKSRREDLVRAGALILAEIERLDRAEARSAETQGS